MSEIIHADIFFFITAVAVILLTVIFGVALIYVVLIVRDLRAIVARVRRASESLESDLNAFREEVKQEGYKARALVDVALGFIARKLTKAVRPKKVKETEEN